MSRLRISLAVAVAGVLAAGAHVSARPARRRPPLTPGPRWLDLVIGRAGALAAGDPNVIALPPVVEHTLPDGSPPAVGTGSVEAGPEP